MNINKGIRGLRIYLDTNIINYLYDFRGDYWKDWLPEIDKRAKVDKSSQIDEYLALETFLVLAYWNEFELIIGNEMLDELEDNADEDRRVKLLSYAMNMRDFYYHHRDVTLEKVRELNREFWETDLHLACRDEKDWLLVKEAIELGCGCFLTTDQHLKSMGAVSNLIGLEVHSPASFINEIIQINPRLLELQSYDLAPDISGLSTLIPDEGD